MDHNSSSPHTNPDDAPDGSTPVAPTTSADPAITGPLAQWRELMLARPAMTPDDVDELEDHLLGEVEDLRSLGLRPDEAFLIAVKRLGAQDALSREYSEVHSDRLWRQLVLLPSDGARAGSGIDDTGAGGTTTSATATATSTATDAATAPTTALTTAPTAGRPRPTGVPRSTPRAAGLPVGTIGRGASLVLAVVLGLAAGLAERLPAEVPMSRVEVFYAHNVALILLPFLVVLLATRSRAWERARGGLALLVAVFAGSALVVNLFPSHGSDQTLFLTAIHLPIALLVVTGIAHLGARWRSLEAWMDWIRFLGEAAVYYVLVALAGGFVLGLLSLVFRSVGVDDATLETAAGWIVPVCAAGAVLVVAWLVEGKRTVIENMAPVLTALFTPVLTVALIVFLVVAAVTGSPVHMDREVLIAFDVLLVVVAAIVAFTVSARDPLTRARALDWMQWVMILAAIGVDVLMLWAMSGRLVEFGTSPNKLAALGANLLLLAHLVGSAWNYWGVLARGRTSLRLERWQCVALPVAAVWAGFVALVFPPLFAFQ